MGLVAVVAAAVAGLVRLRLIILVVEEVRVAVAAVAVAAQHVVHYTRNAAKTDMAEVAMAEHQKQVKAVLERAKTHVKLIMVGIKLYMEGEEELPAAMEQRERMDCCLQRIQLQFRRHEQNFQPLHILPRSTL